MSPDRYAREPIDEESGRDRATSFGEILHAYTKEEAMLEAQRCLQCAMPFCVQACPISQDCRGYIQLIGEGKFDEAATLTLRDNSLATVLCKTCYHYCEEDCVMGGRGVPIAIRHLKRAALEFGDATRLYVPAAPRSERIAIVGGGPAGLNAAWELCLRGYAVTLFEVEPFLGGQIATIPKYHLDDDDLDRDLARFRSFDCTFVTGKRAGVDFTPESLLADGYLAVYVAIGASGSRALGIEGEHLPGVFSALHFLLAVNKGPNVLLGRTNRKIVVIGGGDVAFDAARSGLRLSDSHDVTIVYRKTRADLPAGGEEVEGAEAEGIKFVFERAPVRIEGSGQVVSLVVQATRPGPPDPKGRPTVVLVPGSDETIPCDTVIVAAGERAELAGLPTELNFKLSAQGWPEGEHEDWMTDVNGVFASGGKSVVYAMAAGSKAAEAIDAYIARKKGRAPLQRPDAFGAPKPPKPPAGYGGPTWHL
ncbi:MAG: FAD-dependent oxidoreductase [Thermoplasmata archaeon]|nr:FAD-dependent oxidoreductase [Thermoplasmata archaeon]